MEAAIELSARLFMYVAESIAGDQYHVTFQHLQAFASTYLTTKAIHSLTFTFDTTTHKTVLSAYFLAFAALKAREIDASTPKQESALQVLAAGFISSSRSGGVGIKYVFLFLLFLF